MLFAGEKAESVKMSGANKTRHISLAVAICAVWFATAIGVNGRPAEQALPSEAATPAAATEEELTAIYLRMEDDFARRQVSPNRSGDARPAAGALPANATADLDSDVTSDPRRIGGLY
jgi:hypothetical protein